MGRAGRRQPPLWARRQGALATWAASLLGIKKKAGQTMKGTSCGTHRRSHIIWEPRELEGGLGSSVLVYGSPLYRAPFRIPYNDNNFKSWLKADF